MRIFLTGANGQVGYELHRSLACLGDVYAAERSDLDLTDTIQIETVIKSYQPDLIVNAAAYTAVDKAEQEIDIARAVNTDAPATMAKIAQELDIPLVHYSTDYVFNGENSRPWLETDVTQPLGVYGQTKLDGELAIIESGCRYLIFRTSWVYGSRGQNFLLTMKRLAADRAELCVVDDQQGAPTWSRHIADATALILSQSTIQSDFWTKHSGLYHLTAAGQVSWHGFAQAIFDKMSECGETVPELHAITSEQYPTPAKRPQYSCLDNSKLAEHFQLNLPDWRHSLQLVMQELD